MVAYIRSLVQDPLFVRVCMFLWGLPLAVLGLLVGFKLHPSGPADWLLVALFTAIGMLGAYLIIVSVFGSAQKLEQASQFMHEGGDVLAIVFVLLIVLVALPATAALRALLGSRNK